MVSKHVLRKAHAAGVFGFVATGPLYAPPSFSFKHCVTNIRKEYPWPTSYPNAGSGPDVARDCSLFAQGFASQVSPAKEDL